MLRGIQHVRHALAAHNKNDSIETGLPPDEVNIGWYPGLPMAILEGGWANGLLGVKKTSFIVLGLRGTGGCGRID